MDNIIDKEFTNQITELENGWIETPNGIFTPNEEQGLSAYEVYENYLYNLNNPPIQKPTLEELKEYCSQMGYKVDAEKFYLYYEQCGWTVGKNKPMKDWRASLRLWNMNQSQYQERAREQSKVASLNFSNEECEKQLKDEVIPF